MRTRGETINKRRITLAKRKAEKTRNRQTEKEKVRQSEGVITIKGKKELKQEIST